MTRQPWDITEEMFLSLDEVGRLLRSVRRGDGPDDLAVGDRLLVEVLLFSGLRCSEFCRVRLRDTIVGTGRSAINVRAAGRDGRTVWIPRRVSRLIEQHARRRLDVGRGSRGGLPQPAVLDQPLLPSERGRPYERTGLYRRVVRVLTQSGLGQRGSVQLLRHTYGYLAYLRTGGNLLFVQRQLGHAHPMITSVYARFVPEPYANLADLIAGDAPRSRSAASPLRRRSAARSRP